MIRIEQEKRHYVRCNACQGVKDVKRIVYSHDENQLSSMRLCENCRLDLKIKLFASIQKESEDGNKSKIVASLKDTILFQDILKLLKKLIDDERIDRKIREEYEQKLKEIALEEESEGEE